MSEYERLCSFLDTDTVCVCRDKDCDNIVIIQILWYHNSKHFVHFINDINKDIVFYVDDRTEPFMVELAKEHGLKLEDVYVDSDY